MRYIIPACVLTTLLNACFTGSPGEPGKSVTVEASFAIDSLPGECTYLTKDNQGNAVLSWVRRNDDSSKTFCYYTSRDGRNFMPPILIPGTGNVQPHGENLPKIIFKPTGDVIALWGAANPGPRNKYAGMVFYAQSFDGGKTWERPTPLVKDSSAYDQRYYDVALLPDGEVGIIWLDNRKTTGKEGSAMYFATTRGRTGFQEAKLISEPACPCCRTDLYIDKKGYIHALYRGIIHDSIRDMVHIVSKDEGRTFSDPEKISEDNWVINGCPHTGPSMTESTTGLHFAWYTGGRNPGSFYTRSHDNGSTFMKQDGISALGSHPQISAMPGGAIGIAWDETVTVGNRAGKRIGFQLRSPEGKHISKTYLTPEEEKAAYPVLLPAGENLFLVAYTRTVENISSVHCLLVRVSNEAKNGRPEKIASTVTGNEGAPARAHCSPEAIGISK